jgi:flagellar biogenesis protein FliO
VHLIRVGNRTLLVGVAPGGCTLLERSETVDPSFRLPTT